MIILGINHSHDAGAAIINGGEIVSVINEERLNGVKNYWGFPHLAIAEVIRQAKIKPQEIDIVAMQGLGLEIGESDEDTPEKMIANFKTKKNMQFARRIMYPLSNFSFVESMIFSKIALSYARFVSIPKLKKIKNILRKKGINANLVKVEHHHAHACTAFLTSPYKNCLVYTCDLVGDFICCSVYKCDLNGMTRIKEMAFYSSPAIVYAWITCYLGFTPLRHEGKLTGLAAYGDSDKTYKIFANYMKLSKDKSVFKRKIRRFWYTDAMKLFKKDLNNFSREDVCAGLQKRFEEVISQNVNYYVKKTGRENIALAGGVFANVKLNQEILKLEGVKNIFIHPGMGDGGLALGAALSIWAKNRLSHGEKLKSFDIQHVYFGPEYSNDKIEKELKKSKLKYRYILNIERKIAELIHKNFVVARFNGGMEYGPRALGNRSILYNAKDKKTNDWLNKRLGRTEFMPFAPVTLEEDAKESYNLMEGGLRAAKFMTITFDVKKEFAKTCPAVTHIDGTARPQLINESDNPSYYKIVKEYKKLSGISTIVNTSFNMHEWPIVCSPNDAIRSFSEGNLDYLAIGNYLVSKKSI